MLNSNKLIYYLTKFLSFFGELQRNFFMTFFNFLWLLWLKLFLWPFTTGIHPVRDTLFGASILFTKHILCATFFICVQNFFLYVAKKNFLCNTWNCINWVYTHSVRFFLQIRPTAKISCDHTNFTSWYHSNQFYLIMIMSLNQTNFT